MGAGGGGEAPAVAAGLGAAGARGPAGTPGGPRALPGGAPRAGRGGPLAGAGLESGQGRRLVLRPSGWHAAPGAGAALRREKQLPPPPGREGAKEGATAARGRPPSLATPTSCSLGRSSPSLGGGRRQQCPCNAAPPGASAVSLSLSALWCSCAPDRLPLNKGACGQPAGPVTVREGGEV